MKKRERKNKEPTYKKKYRVVEREISKQSCSPRQKLKRLRGMIEKKANQGSFEAARNNGR